MYIVPTVPHLRNLKLTVEYRELPENEAQMNTWCVTQKWKNDPDADRFYGFAPRHKFYINGEMVDEEKPGLAAVSKTPFPETRVPRRGFTAVQPDDPDYARLCREQGLDHLLGQTPSPSLPNGVHSSPLSGTTARADTNGGASPSQVGGPVVNGHQDSSVTPPVGTQPKPLVNGINGVGEGD